MSLGREVELGPGDIVLVGAQLPPRKGAQHTLSSQMCTQLSTLIVHMSSVHKIMQLLLGSQGTSFH